MRHDLAPLSRRVKLPPAVTAATWWAEPVFDDSGLLPLPDQHHRIAAWMPLPSPTSDPTFEVLIEVERAEHLLPLSLWETAPRRDGKVVLDGRTVTPPLEPLRKQVGVTQAAWLDGGLWLELYQSAQ